MEKWVGMYCFYGEGGDGSVCCVANGRRFWGWLHEANRQRKMWMLRSSCGIWVSLLWAFSFPSYLESSVGWVFSCRASPHSLLNPNCAYFTQCLLQQSVCNPIPKHPFLQSKNTAKTRWKSILFTPSSHPNSKRSFSAISPNDYNHIMKCWQQSHLLKFSKKNKRKWKTAFKTWNLSKNIVLLLD